MGLEDRQIGKIAFKGDVDSSTKDRDISCEYVHGEVEQHSEHLITRDTEQATQEYEVKPAY